MNTVTANTKPATKAGAKERNTSTFKAGENIFCQGDYGDEAYIIIEGEVELSDTTGEGKKRKVGKIGPGGLFGEMAIFDQKRRFVDAKALSEVKAHVLNENALMLKIQQNPSFAMKLMRMITGNAKLFQNLS